MPNFPFAGSRWKQIVGVAAVALIAVGALGADDPFGLPDKDGPDAAWWRDSRTNLDERLAWWRDARFGMFIHWGVYSGLGNEFEGHRGGGYAEHIQRVLKIPIPVYRKEVAGTFDPTNFNADAWVSLAKEAGMKYIVITAKHHDGFAMWPTKVNDYNIMDATPWHHDPMADLRAACDRQGIKFGFYYSQAFDWGNQYAPGNDWDYNNPGGDKKIGGADWWKTKPEFMASARKYVDEKSIPQILELIRMYHPDILWFDTSSKLPPSENLRIMKAIRAVDSHVVISGRLVPRWGDYDDTTDRPANFPPHDGDWEGIPTTDESYGWNKFDTSHKPPSHFIQLLAKAAARGGNLLLNVGPMGDGNIDPKDVAILQGIGTWWQVNGESIRGTTRTPLTVQTWGESTRKGNTLYLHVFNWPADGKLVVGGLLSNVKTAALLADLKSGKLGDTALPVGRLNAQDVIVTVPPTAPDKVDSVVVVQCDGEIQTDTNRLLQPEFPMEVLRAFDAELDGGLRYGPGKKTDDEVMNWNKPGQSVSWAVRLDEPATYDVAADYSVPRGGSGGSFSVSVGSQTVKAEVKSGADPMAPIGRITLPPGDSQIKLAAISVNGDELFQLRSLVLKPVPAH